MTQLEDVKIELSGKAENVFYSRRKKSKCSNFFLKLKISQNASLIIRRNQRNQGEIRRKIVSASIINEQPNFTKLNLEIHSAEQTPVLLSSDEITRDYAGKDLAVVGVLKGSEFSWRI